MRPCKQRASKEMNLHQQGGHLGRNTSQEETAGPDGCRYNHVQSSQPAILVNFSSCRSTVVGSVSPSLNAPFQSVRRGMFKFLDGNPKTRALDRWCTWNDHDRLQTATSSRDERIDMDVPTHLWPEVNDCRQCHSQRHKRERRFHGRLAARPPFW